MEAAGKGIEKWQNKRPIMVHCRRGGKGHHVHVFLLVAPWIIGRNARVQAEEA